MWSLGRLFLSLRLTYVGGWRRILCVLLPALLPCGIPVLEAQLSSQVCNHKRECHCHAGWAPPHCAQLLADVPAGRAGKVLRTTRAGLCGLPGLRVIRRDPVYLPLKGDCVLLKTRPYSLGPGIQGHSVQPPQCLPPQCSLWLSTAPQPREPG